MPFDQKFPPDGGFPGLDGWASWETVVGGVEHEVNQLTQLPHAPAIRHQLLRVLQERRSGPQPDRPGQVKAEGREADSGWADDGFPPMRFDYLPVQVGYDTLLAQGELLITGRSYDGRHPDAGQAQGAGTQHGAGTQDTAKAYLDAQGIEAASVGCDALAGRILRLVNPHRDMGPEELADLARNLRARGFAASLTHITCTAPVHKRPPVGLNPVQPPGNAQAQAAAQARVQPAPDALARLADRQGQLAPGTPATVAIIDTGIVKERLRMWNVHGEADRLHQFPLGEPRAERLEYLDFDAGHGTFVAGIVLQIAPDADITVYRAVDSDGIGSEVTVACKMIEAVQAGNRIINLSLSCQTHDDYPPIAIQAALEFIREWELKERIPEDERALFVAAAGNYANTRPSWPAAFPGVVSVAGLTPGMQPSLWSSRGFWVTCSTVGEGVLSTYVDGRESPLLTSTPYVFSGPDPWALWSGTSFAAPQITGALAHGFQLSNLSPRAALTQLLATGQPLPEFGQAVKLLKGV